MSDTPDVFARLREPFATEQIGKLAKAKSGRDYEMCKLCNSKHEYPNREFNHVDYVGHAVVTDRLNQMAGPGNWSYTIDQVVERDGHITGIVGTMTVAGRTIGQEVGVPARAGLWGDEFKTAISDYICRAAMRFGVALDLWTKQKLETPRSPEESEAVPGGEARPVSDDTPGAASVASGPAGAVQGEGADTPAPAAGATKFDPVAEFTAGCDALGISPQKAAEVLFKLGALRAKPAMPIIQTWTPAKLSQSLTILEKALKSAAAEANAGEQVPA